ncbi:Mpv17/PMP22 family protein [bacterium]|nr:Mpv17/PMP22 family protein [bacterium]MBU1920356.1 Mpv17/PMP22 family protein [bacterium]
MGFLLWFLSLAAVLFILFFPVTREGFKELTTAYPFIMGAVKFALLGSMGDILSHRIALGKWKLKNTGLVQKACVWAFIGVTITAVFPIFTGGTAYLFEHGYIQQPFSGFYAALLIAFLTSVFMNLTYAPVLMTFHKVTDTVISNGGLFRRWSLRHVMTNIDWSIMLRIPLFAILWFWIPVQTITFMMPPVYRVVFAALLAIILGFILGFASKKSLQTAQS